MTTTKTPKTKQKLHTNTQNPQNQVLWILFRFLLHKDSAVSPVTQVISLHKNLHRLYQYGKSSCPKEKTVPPQHHRFSFFCERSPVNIALSRGLKWFNNSCFSHKFLDSHKANTFPNTVFIMHTPTLWQGNQQLVPRQKVQVWLWPFLD